MPRDYYDVLGISRSATADEIKKAHRKLARKFHPDMNKSNPTATQKFQEVQEAYDVLSDDHKRQNYNQFGHAGVNAGGTPGGGGDPFESFRRSGGGRRGAGTNWQANQNVSVEDFEAGGGGNYSDIFEQLFGSRGGAARGARPQPQRGRAQPAKGEDVEHGVTLDFDKAARGTTLPLQIDRDGKVETIEIKIPAGVKDGSRIRIKGRGQQGGGEPGDLYIITAVQRHPWFRREGLDIYLDVPISAYEAMLGTKVEVPTLDGPVTMSIPPGTSGNAKLRIKGRGIERGSEKGDQYVLVKVVVPKELDDDDKVAVQKLADKRPVNARADVGW